MLINQIITQSKAAIGDSATLPQSIKEGFTVPLHKSLLAETFLQAGPVVKMVLFTLILLSVVCWGIIVYKFFMLRKAGKSAESFSSIFFNASSLMEIYHASRNIPPCHLLDIFDAGYRELSRILSSADGPGASPGADPAAFHLDKGGMRIVVRAMEKAKNGVTSNLERHLTFLATTGSTAPFIGLFGTVWGIMSSFRSIGATGNANLATVAPGIAEALIATAVGLFAAIPAVVAYNFFLQQVRVLTEEMDTFSADLINLIERHLRKPPASPGIKGER